MDELAEFWQHEATVSTYEGAGPFGETYAAPTPVPCFIDETRKFVRAADGREVVSEATITGPVEHGPLFAPESLVEVRGRTATVITQAIRTGGDLDLPDHFEATTT